MAYLQRKAAEKPAVAAEPEVEPEPEADEEPEAKPEASEELTKARAAIERKFKALAPTLLEKMSEAQILAMGVQIAADLKQYGDLANERDRLKKTTTVQSTDRHEEEETEQDGTEAVRPSEAGQPLDFSEILGSLDADLYEGLPDTLTKVANALHQKGQADLKAGLESLVSKFTASQMETVDADVRREMAERFPTLRDPEVAASLRETMKLLEPGMTYSESMDIRERREKLMQHALVLVDANAVVESQGKPSQKAKGGPQPPKDRGAPAARPTDPIAARSKYMQLRKKGFSVERAKADSGLLAEE